MEAAKYGNPAEFNVELHSIYAAYLGFFESTDVSWWEKSWGGYFTGFNEFLQHGWDVMVVVNLSTGRAHVGVKAEQIVLFAKMFRTRYGESLPKDPPTTLPLDPVPTKTLSLRRLVRISDLAGYKKLALTLPAAELAHLRQRVRSGHVETIERMFHAGSRDDGAGYTWACVATTWWDRGGAPAGVVPGGGRTPAGSKGLVLEVGMAVLRCANLHAVGVWPPVPEENYRKSHFVVEEWVDKRTNQSPPSYPRAYAFGRSHYVAEKEMPRILDASLAAIASQGTENQTNTLVLLGCGEQPPLPVPASSTISNNILYLDILALEHRFLRRAREQGVTGVPDRHGPLPHLLALLDTLSIPTPPSVPLGNAGNDAFYTLLAFQKLMMADTTLPQLLYHTAYAEPFVPPYAAPPRRFSSSQIPSQIPYTSSSSSPRHSSFNSEFGRPSSVPRSGSARAQTVYLENAPSIATDVDSPPRGRQALHRNAHSVTALSAARPQSQVSSPLRAPTKLPDAEAKRPKMKSEKSVKDIAGALARFWVG